MKKINKPLKILTPVVFWILIWEVLSLLVKDSLGQLLPGPVEVFSSWVVLLVQGSFWVSCLLTFLRVLVGLLTGITVGFVIGVISHCFEWFNTIISPLMKVIRAVPVISFIFLAFIFFSSDILPIFISVLMVCPIIWQSVKDGLDGTDPALIEVGKMFKLKKSEILMKIKIPGIYKSFVSTVANACGLAWKAELAAEAICTPAFSVGKMMYRAKIVFDFEGIYSLTLSIVIISVLFETVIKTILRKIVAKEGEI